MSSTESSLNLEISHVDCFHVDHSAQREGGGLEAYVGTGGSSMGFEMKSSRYGAVHIHSPLLERVDLRNHGSREQESWIFVVGKRKKARTGLLTVKFF